MGLVSTGSESTGSGSFNHIVGPVVGEQVLINPTLKELNKYGVAWFKTEPNYLLADQDGNKQFAMDVWYKVEPFDYEDKSVKKDAEIRNIRFYIKPTEKVYSTGNVKYVNEFGQFAWKSSMGKFDQTNMREALDGEEDLYKWLRAFGNFGQKDKMRLDRDQLVKGDFSQVIDFAEKSPSRKFIVWLDLSFNEEKGRFNSIPYKHDFWALWQVEPYINGRKVDFPTFAKEVAEDEYKCFKKAMIGDGIRKIITNTEAEKSSNLPNESETINKEAVADDDLPF